MNIEKLTIKQARKISELFAKKIEENSAWTIGENYLIRTVTMINTGRLVAVTPQELVIENAAWVADTGVFSEALKTCEFKEVEPYPDGRVIVGRGSVVDAVIVGVLPTVKK